MFEWIKCFVVGGFLCVIAQILIDKTKLSPARILVGYVVTGVALTGIGIYEKVVDFANFGALIPLSGFGFCLAKGVQEAIEKSGFIGILIGGLEATAGGIAAAICFSLLMSIFFKGKPENL
jgi:stage V sporulation protein AE